MDIESLNDKYGHLTAEDIVKLVVAKPHNEEAAAYLLNIRYVSLLKKLCRDIVKDMNWYGDCMDDLFIHLRGKDGSWARLGTFAGRSAFGTWLKEVAKNVFLKNRSILIGKLEVMVSIDEDNPNSILNQIPVENEDECLRRQQNVLLMEAIGLLESDYKFVILKHLEGYSSKEIAELLCMVWKKNGVKKYNKKNEIVVPTAGYVDVLMDRARKQLKTIIPTL